MKRIYYAALLFAAALIFSAVETGYVSAKADACLSKISSADKLMCKDNFEEAAAVCAELEEYWEENAKNVDMLLIHDYVDEIGESISRMKAYAENAGVEMYFSESAAAKKELASVKESEFPYIENIL